jgi:competence protein ComEC
VEGVHLGLGGVAASYAAIVTATGLALRFGRRLQIARLRRPATGRDVFSFHAKEKTLRLVAVCVAIVVVALAWGLPRGNAGAEEPPRGLRVTVLDVGQGDAILLQPAVAPAVLVDGGPPGDDLAGKLRDAGVEALGAAIVTHDQSDHAGGVEELLGGMPIEKLVFGRLGRRLLAEARGAGATPLRAAEGDVLRSGALRLQVLSPPAEQLVEPLAEADPNAQALVVLARWRDFTMLLAADAEAEAAPVDPGPIDVLKVAHHGSDDAGLGTLLDRTAPKLAVISVGEDNSYGHPTPGTLATLAGHGVRTLRTDLDGDITLDVGRGAIRVSTDD